MVQGRLSDLSLPHPRQWGGGGRALRRWEPRRLDGCWDDPLLPSRKGTRWRKVRKILVCQRLRAAGSAWQWPRQWFGQTARADWLGEDSRVAKDPLDRCRDRWLRHQKDFCRVLRRRGQALFGAGFDGLLDDLPSPYCDGVPPPEGQRRFGDSRDKRSDGGPVVIALLVTRAGFPLAYAGRPGNRRDQATLNDCLAALAPPYGKADRGGVMARGLPAAETLPARRQADPPLPYRVGTPQGRLPRLAKPFLTLPWAAVREAIPVNWAARDDELTVLARSEGRAAQQRARRRRRLQRRWRRPKEGPRPTVNRDERLLKLGAAQQAAGRAFGRVASELAGAGQPVPPATFGCRLGKQKRRQTRRREGGYRLPSTLTDGDPAAWWRPYTPLTEIAQACKELNGDLGLRPLYPPRDPRLEAPRCVAFSADCRRVTRTSRARCLAAGLTPRAIRETLSAIQRVEVPLPPADGRPPVLPRVTQPAPDPPLLLKRLGLTLPCQPPPRIQNPLAIAHPASS